MTWISTLSGRKIDLLAPDPDQIDIEDVAAGLAALPRWCGQTQARGRAVHYSVAQHSWLCSKRCPTHALAALLHDAAEAYMGDCPRPLKALLGGAWHEIESRLQAAIFARYGLPPEIPAAVKRVDDRLLMTERRDLQPLCPPWDPRGDGSDWPKPYPWHVAPWPPGQARVAFAAQLRRLTAAAGVVA